MTKLYVEDWWKRDVQNFRAAFGVFGGAPPPLEKLQLSEVSLRDPSEITMALTRFDLPENSPRVWYQKQYDALQFRLLFSGVINMRIEGVFPRTTTLTSLLFEQKKVNIKIAEPYFYFSVEYYKIFISLFPFKIADYASPPPRWHSGI